MGEIPLFVGQLIYDVVVCLSLEIRSSCENSVGQGFRPHMAMFQSRREASAWQSEHKNPRPPPVINLEDRNDPEDPEDPDKEETWYGVFV